MIGVLQFPGSCDERPVYRWVQRFTLTPSEHCRHSTAIGATMDGRDSAALGALWEITIAVDERADDVKPLVTLAAGV